MWNKNNVSESFAKQVNAAIESRRTRISHAERLNLGTEVCEDYLNTIDNLESLKPGCRVSGMCRIRGDRDRKEVTGVLHQSNEVFISGDSIMLEVEGIENPVSVLLEDIVEVLD